MFIKPLPKDLLSLAFWEFYLVSATSPIQDPLRSDLKRAALGFLQSYAWLVRHRSDFDLAMHEDHRLLPKRVRYTSFVSLIKSFETVGDDMVSPRYHYGELRLTRLNFWSKILLFRLTYHKVEGQYGAYFARFYGPILFLFALFSVLLSAMQVVLAVQDLIESDASWEAFAKVSRGFSVFALVIIAIMVLFLLLALVTISSREVLYALTDLYRKKHSRRYTKGGSQSLPNGD